MRPIAIIDAWPEPTGDVVLMRSRLFPRQVAVLLSARRKDGRVQRRTCIRLGGEDVFVSDSSVLTARARQLFRDLVNRLRRDRSDHGHAG
jgi:hypothetical protein